MTTEEIRKLLEAGKLTIGLNQTRSAIEAGSSAKVIIASNAPASEADAIRDYAEMSDVETVTLEMRNDQLGNVCRKPFPIAFISVNK